MIAAPWVPREKVEELVSEHHVGVLFFAETFNNRHGFSNKVSLYLFHGLPLLANVQVAARRLIEEFGCGVFLENLDEESLAAALRRIVNDYEEMSAGALRAVGFLREEHERQVNAFLEAVKKLMRRPDGD